MSSNRWLPSLACLGVIAAVAATGASSSLPATSPMPLALQHRHDPIKDKKHRDDGVWNSTNWSGYSVTGPNGSVTEVSGSWIVPAVTCPTTTSQYSSFWVGIDGFNSNTVEQTGTDSDCSGTTPRYYAWFEFYPKSSYLITAAGIGPITPGIVISADVKYNGAGSYTLTLINHGPGGKTFTLTQNANGANSSAEWIAEAPSSGGVLTIANFGTAFFTNSTATVSGVNGTIGSFLEPGCTNAGCSNVVQELTMVQSTGAGAQPSGLDAAGGAFSDSYVGPNAPPPPPPGHKKHGSS